MARERSRGRDPRLRRSMALGLQHRWWAVLAIALQRTVANIVLHPEGADLHRAQLEPGACLHRSSGNLVVRTVLLTRWQEDGIVIV